LTAALYAAREGLSVLVVERAGVGGQAGVTERLDNFPGFPEGVSGDELAQRLRQQAERFGVEVLPAQRSPPSAAMGTTGRSRRETSAPTPASRSCSRWARPTAGSTSTGEGDLIGAGVHFCATCDGPFYRGERVVVIGGGNSAGEESVFLARFAAHVTVVTRDDSLSASRVVVTKLQEHPRISVITGAATTGFAVDADGRLRALLVERDGRPEEVPAKGAFVFIGLTPQQLGRHRLVDLDAAGFVMADTACRPPCPASSSQETCAAARPSRLPAPPAKGPRQPWPCAATSNPSPAGSVPSSHSGTHPRRRCWAPRPLHRAKGPWRRGRRTS
jgi:thioredoxin reductase (NADPH)